MLQGSFLGVAVCAGVLAAGVPSPDRARATAILDEASLRFEPNVGQLDPAVRYFARAPGYSLQLTAREARLSLGAGDSVRLRLRNARPNPRLEPLEPLASTSSYFLGRRPESWKTAVPHYAKVRYAGLYPGIDLVFYGNGRQLEYDFVVAPGADPERIALRFDGAAGVRLEAGELVVRAGERELRQRAPVAYQQIDGRRVAVPAAYALAGGEVRFLLGDYDRRQRLVIDPVLVYSTFLGGSNADTATAIAADSSGRIWVAGFYGGQNFPVTADRLGESSGGGLDVFVARLNPAKSGVESLEFSAFLGGAQTEQPSAILVDDAGDVYLTGYTTSSNFPLAGEARQTSAGGGRDAFLVKLTAADGGALLYSTFSGGPGHEEGNAIALDAARRVHIVGYTESRENFPLAGEPLQGSNRGGWDSFLAVFDLTKAAAETLAYSTYFGGVSTDLATAVAVDRAGIVHLAGYTISDDFPVAGDAFFGDQKGRGDAFLAKFDLTRPGLEALIYSSYFGGTELDVAYAMLFDAGGGVWLAGYTLSKNLPLAGDPAQSTNAGNTDLFLARLDLTRPAADQLTYATYLGGGDGDVAYGMAMDAAGRIYLAGYTVSRDFPLRINPLQAAYGGGGADGFLIQFDPSVPGPDGLRFSTYLGGRGIESVYGLTLDAAGNIYLAGFTQADGFPIREGALKESLEGITDAFVSKLNP